MALDEWILDGAVRVLTIVFALNRVWQPTTKRLAERVAPLAVKPDRLAERIEEALTDSNPRRALRVMTELQLDTVLLAPSGPNVERARTLPRERTSCAQGSLWTDRRDSAASRQAVVALGSVAPTCGRMITCQLRSTRLLSLSPCRRWNR